MRFVWIAVIMIVLASCSAGKNAYNPSHRFSLKEVERDYSLYRSILETHHPGLYWYTTKDSMDLYFSYGKNQLKEGMTEPEFRKVLAYVTSQINCGHTTIRGSKGASSYVDTSRNIRVFPLSMKLWDDTIVVTANLNRRDSILKRGTIIKSINGRTDKQIIDSLFNYISADGYNVSHKYQTLSNRGFFGTLYTTVFGMTPFYNIDYIDSLGNPGNTRIPLYNPGSDTSLRAMLRNMQSQTPQERPSRRERKQRQLSNVRLLQIDTVKKSAMMNLATFGRGYGLKKFFRRSFRALRKNDITDFIIDVRTNGGGSVTNSTTITKFLSDKPFKVADSLYAVKKKSAYGKYIQNNFWNRLFMTFFTSKKKDGNYHFGYFERKYFKPKKKNHYDGKVYIITGGNSFSATTLFASALREQENVVIVGEETGGGSYGNSAWLIPDVTLPETGVRFRLPLFRLVIDAKVEKNGRGVMPEVESKPTLPAIRKNNDFKLEKVLELINN